MLNGDSRLQNKVKVTADDPKMEWFPQSDILKTGKMAFIRENQIIVSPPPSESAMNIKLTADDPKIRELEPISWSPYGDSTLIKITADDPKAKLWKNFAQAMTELLRRRLDLNSAMRKAISVEPMPTDILSAILDIKKNNDAKKNNS